MSTDATVYKISLSEKKGEKKQNVEQATLITEFGLKGDAHGGSARQLSLLPFESFAKMANDTLTINPGDFAENITTVGLDFSAVRVGHSLRIGESIRLKITQIGKECHHGCIIRETVGDCIMPREGIFAEVLQGGEFKVGDRMRWANSEV